MAEPNKSIPPEFEALSAEERIRYVQNLWDYIAVKPSEVEVSQEHKRILDERLDAYRTNPDSGRPWHEVREELIAALRNP